MSYSITREKAPIYTMGSPDPGAFSRNKRGIAGSLVWVNFDRHALLNLVYQLGGQFVANVDDLKPQFMTNQSAFLSQTAIFQSTLIRDSGQSAGATIDQFDGQPVSAVSGFKEVASPWYSDQILPLDITLAGTNEEGAASAMKITGKRRKIIKHRLTHHSRPPNPVLTQCFHLRALPQFRNCCRVFTAETCLEPLIARGLLHSAADRQPS